MGCMPSKLLPTYTVLQSVPSSGSGRGISYHKGGAECGRRTNLAARFKVDLQADDEQEAESASKPIGRIVGTHFHSLQQYWREGKLPDDIALGANEADVHFREAVRAFQVYRRFWPVDYFGHLVGCEIKFPHPDRPDEAEYLREQLGDDFTFRTDAIYYLNQADCDKLENERGVSLPEGPGRYIIDYKCRFQITSVNMWDAQFGAQSIAYPMAYNLLHARFPDRYPEPVKGMIFDEMSRQPQKDSTFALKHFQLFVAQTSPNDIDIVRALIAQSKHNIENDLANPGACIGHWGPCAFLKGGQCSRK